MNRITAFLFTNSNTLHPDPVWFIGVVIGIAFLFLLLGFFGTKLLSRDEQKAGYKTLKKSSGWLKFFGITILLLLWFRLEALRFISMNFWWTLYIIAFLWFLIVKMLYYRALSGRIARGKREGR